MASVTLAAFIPGEGGKIEFLPGDVDFDHRDFHLIHWLFLAAPSTTRACWSFARLQGEMSALTLELMWTGATVPMDGLIGRATVRLAKAIVRYVLPWFAEYTPAPDNWWIRELDVNTLAAHALSFVQLYVAPMRLKVDRYWQSIGRRRTRRTLYGVCGAEIDAWVP